MQNLGTNSREGEISFLTLGTYIISSITTEQKHHMYQDYIARVSRSSNGTWSEETVNLAFLFSNGSKGPLYGFQRNKLVDEAIKITKMLPHSSSKGGLCFSYYWELTEVTPEQRIDYINQSNNQLALKRQEIIIDAQQDSELLDCEENLTDFLSDLNKQIALRKLGNS